MCVRYRYDEQRHKRYKTVELIVEEQAWEPPPPPPPADAVVAIRVGPAELALRQQVKAAGGKWNPDRRVWEVRYGHVVALGLVERTVREGAN